MSSLGTVGIASFVASLASAAVIVRVVRDLALRRALLDRPNDRSSHVTPRPRLGGVGVVVPVLAVGVGLVVSGRAPLELLVPVRRRSRGAPGPRRRPPAAPGLGPLRRAGRAGVDRGGRLVEPPPGRGRRAGRLAPRPVLAALAVLWIVWLTNLYNFMDGIDGIAGVQALIASLGLAMVAGGLGAPTTGWLLLALAGSSVGFLLFNFPPSSIFMGDVGSTAIGFFFGVLPLLPEARPVPFEPVALALSLFVLDSTTTLIRRMAAGEKVVHAAPDPPVPAAGRDGQPVTVPSCWWPRPGWCSWEGVRWRGPGRPGSGGSHSWPAPIALFLSGSVAVRRMERRA